MSGYNLKEPLIDYPWKQEVERIIRWVKKQDVEYRPFIFDLCMSLAYIDSTSGLERHLQTCPSCPDEFDSHLGFINLCSPCYEKKNIWQYQKAAKPQSGALGKLSSEIILKFVEIIFDEFIEVYSIGGTETADAQLKHMDGSTILAEVKSAPLLTFPLLIKTNHPNKEHTDCPLTSSQFRELESAIYMHNKQFIPLGIVKSENWPSNESISDSKTSAGMDRTDDIKKGIYQVLKLGILNQNNTKIKTALISNLPAFRHGKEYVEPFVDLIWSSKKNIIKQGENEFVLKKDMRYFFDHIITLESQQLS